jgi:hypothetical protein
MSVSHEDAIYGLALAKRLAEQDERVREEDVELPCFSMFKKYLAKIWMIWSKFNCNWFATYFDKIYFPLVS